MCWGHPLSSKRVWQGICLAIVVIMSSGCSVLIKEGYNASPSKSYDWNDVAAVTTQTDAVRQFGSPTAALPCPDGWQLASYHLPQRQRQSLLVSGEAYDASKDAAEDVLILGSDFLTFGLAEVGWTIASLYQVYKANHERPEFWATFLYTPEGQVRYRIEAKADPLMCAP